MGYNAATRTGRRVVAAFAALIALGTVLLMLPVSVDQALLADEVAFAAAQSESILPVSFGGAPLNVALFTATSASSVTGLILVDTATYWSTFGLIVIAVLMQIGGIGTMTVAALVSLVMVRRLGLKERLTLANSTGFVNLGQTRSVVLGIVRWALLVELCGAAILTAFFLHRGYPLAKALGHATFLAISAFDNAGFSPYTASVMDFSGDAVVLLTIAALLIIGGLGFPVLFEINRHMRGVKQWSLTAKMVLIGTGGLIGFGWLVLAALEWNNPGTLGAMSVPDKLLNSFFAAVTPRTAGFNSIDMTALQETSMLITVFLMFIGGGPAGTAGGIKVTTAIMIGFITLTEIRGERAVNVFGRRLDRAAHRQALTVVTLSTLILCVGTLLIMIDTGLALSPALFEVTSAFGTVGLSVGITAQLTIFAQLVLSVIMIAGRMGPLTIATAVALRRTKLHYELPKDYPLIG
ncbi:MAG: potassium transporter TrkG [Trueperella sp.]|nr:potassium transporter TrkG [Trueperella sp.]